MTSGTYWNYQRDEINDDANENSANNIKTKKKIKKTIASKSFEYKTIIIKRPENDSILDTEVAAPLKQMSSFWWLHD